MSDLSIFWSLLLTYLIHSTILLGATWLLFRLGKWQSPALRETAWKFAAVMPFVTTALHVGSVTAFWSIPIPISLEQEELTEPQSQKPVPELFVQEKIREKSKKDISQQELLNRLSQLQQKLEEQPPAVRNEEKLPHANRRNTNQESVDAVAMLPLESDSSGSFGKSIQPAFSPSIFNLKYLLNGLAFLLGAVFCLGIVRMVVNFGRLNWDLQNATPVNSGRSVEMLTKLKNRFDIKRHIRLFQLEQISEPAACGWLNWSILLPCQLESELSDDELEAVLSHELAHLVRRDIWWLWFGRAICWGCPFQPLNFLAQREWRDAAESLCDQWVIAQGVSRFSLARSLTSVAALAQENRVAYSLSATGSGGKQLTERVENLLEEKKDRFHPWTRRGWLITCSILIVSGLLICSPQFVIQASQPTKGAQPRLAEETVQSAAAEQSITHTFSKEFDQTHQEAVKLRESLRELVPETVRYRSEIQERSQNLLDRTEQITTRLERLRQRLLKLEQTDLDLKKSTNH